MVVPCQLKIYPALAAAAMLHHWEAALAMWTLARALDPAGRGLLAYTTLATTAATLGLSRRRVRRWLAQAQGLGLLTPCHLQRTPQPVWRISGLAQVAWRAELPCLSGQPVWLPASVLRGCQRWRAWLWAAWLTGQRRDQAPMARAAMAQCTGISESTQRAYERITGVAVTRHYAVSDERATAALVTGMWGNEVHPGAFPCRATQPGRRPREVVAWPLPSTYQTALFCAPRGQLRRINRRLRAQGHPAVPPMRAALPPDVLLNTGDGHRPTAECGPRVFYRTYRAAVAAARQSRATGPPDAWGNPSRQTDWYYPRRRQTRQGARLWGVV